MKKLVTILLTIILLSTAVLAFGCNNQPEKGKVNIKYYADGGGIVNAILGGKETIGLVPEPAATALIKQASAQEKTIYRLDLQELYNSTEKAYPQAVLMVKKSVIGAHSELVENLKNKVTESTSWIKSNTSDAVKAINDNGGSQLKAPALNEQAIDACKIYWQGAQEAKSSVQNYINGIIEIDSKKASAVNDDFFYSSVETANPKDEYRFIMPDGAPALAMAKVIYDNDELGTDKNISYSVVASSQIQANLADGGADFIVAPVNLASKLYKAKSTSDHYVMVAVLTHGNFYIMSTEKITVKDLADKQVAVPMMGAVPDWTFKMVLEKHDLSYQTVE